MKLPMQARFTTSIAGDRFSYDTDAVVRVSDRFGPEEVPAALAEAWLKAGILEAVVPIETADRTASETASLRQTARSKARAR